MSTHVIREYLDEGDSFQVTHLEGILFGLVVMLKKSCNRYYNLGEYRAGIDEVLKLKQECNRLNQSLRFRVKDTNKIITIRPD